MVTASPYNSGYRLGIISDCLFEFIMIYFQADTVFETLISKYTFYTISMNKSINTRLY